DRACRVDVDPGGTVVHFQVVDLDVEKVRSQLADELSRPVTDLEVFVWLRRCGFVRFNNLWITDTRSLRKMHPIFRDISANIEEKDEKELVESSAEFQPQRHR